MQSKSSSVISSTKLRGTPEKLNSSKKLSSPGRRTESTYQQRKTSFQEYLAGQAESKATQ